MGILIKVCKKSIIEVEFESMSGQKSNPGLMICDGHLTTSLKSYLHDTNIGNIGNKSEMIYYI